MLVMGKDSGMGGYRFLAPSWASPCVAFPFMSPPQFQGEYVVLQARNGLRVAFGWLKLDRYYYYHQRLCRTAINFFLDTRQIASESRDTYYDFPSSLAIKLVPNSVSMDPEIARKRKLTFQGRYGVQRRPSAAVIDSTDISYL